MIRRDQHRPAPCDEFERRIRHQFGLSLAIARAISELRYQGNG